MSRVADTSYRSGFYRPNVNDPEYRPGGWRMPCGSLPRFVPMDPQHVPSTVTFIAPAADDVGAFGGRRERFVRIARTECSCGATWARTSTVASDVPDDVTVRGLHVTHTLATRSRTREKAA